MSNSPFNPNTPNSQFEQPTKSTTQMQYQPSDKVGMWKNLSGGDFVTGAKQVGQEYKQAFNNSVDVTSDAFPVIDDENEVIGTCHVHFDLAVTCEQSGTNLTRSCLQGMAASAYAAKKIREAGEKDIVLQEPDRFLPAIMETAGFMHGDLRAALYDIAIRHVDISVTDTALSKEQRHSLIGITLSGYF